MLSDQDFLKLLGEHVDDDRAERALRDDREAWRVKVELERARVPDKVWELEMQLMRERMS